MSKTEIISQVIGAIGMFSLFVMYQQSDRKRYLYFKLLSDVLWAVHYLLLYAIGGAIPNIVGIAREIVFINDTKKWANRRIWAPIFIAINASLAIMLADSLIQFIPICASALVTVSLTFSKTSNIRLLAIPISTAFLIYDLIVGSYAGALNETISLVSMISKSVMEHRKGKD